MRFAKLSPNIKDLAQGQTVDKWWSQDLKGGLPEVVLLTTNPT